MTPPSPVTLVISPRAAFVEYEIAARWGDPNLKRLAALQEHCTSTATITRCVSAYCAARQMVPNFKSRAIADAGMALSRYNALTTGDPMRTLAFVDQNATQLCKKNDKPKKNDKDPPDDGPLLGRQKLALPTATPGVDIWTVRGWGHPAAAVAVAGVVAVFCRFFPAACMPRPALATLPTTAHPRWDGVSDDGRIL